MNKFIALLAAVVCSAIFQPATAQQRLELEKGDRVILIGNTLAEREQYFGRFETLLHARFPEHQLAVRNLGWSADELNLRPRSQDFKDHGHTLSDHKADVILAFFGFNESFAGLEGLDAFKSELDKFITSTLASKYNGETAPRLALISPIAHEDLGQRTLPSGEKNNQNIALYTEAMAEVAARHDVPFVDLFEPSKKLYAESDQPLTINGVHLSDYGYLQVAPFLVNGLFGAGPAAQSQPDFDKLREEVNAKNLQFFYDHRATNGFYIYGGRKKPFGVVNFPPEFAKLRAMIARHDQRIWAVAQGKQVPAEVDYSGTGEFAEIKTNFNRGITINPPEEAIKSFKLPEGYEINLFASEVEFPELENPVQCAFDARGRLWVATMPTYPMYLPGELPDDKILILEDTDGDGKADKQTVFADGLHIPTGIELGDGGAYVAQQPNLMFLRDTDGDDVADERRLILHGFDSADSHHSLSAFEWGPGGALYFQEGTFHHTQVETPYGPERCVNAGVFRYEPRTEKFDVFVSYRFANPWGHVFDRWGQNFVADASGGANYYGTAFSGDIDYPRKHPGMKQFLTKEWRPTAGCELVASRNFPAEAQGNYLLNNCIGFQGVLNYKMADDGSGFHATPEEPLLKSDDPNFRPVDIQFGPDGALYLCDWFNPLVGHMQHSLRDPNRDTNHGRIWRVHYTGNPLVEPPQIAGASIAQLLDALKVYEDRDRFRARRELRLHDTDKVMAELDAWLAKLDKNDPQYEHHRLEALWVHQHHDVADQQLLGEILRSPDYRARAAATRVLCYWRDKVETPLDLLRVQVNDEHPRVRLEAVRALSFFHDPAALDVALESLAHEQDYYLEYTLKETLATLENRMK